MKSLLVLLSGITFCAVVLTGAISTEKVTQKPEDKLKESIARGEQLYQGYCASCHMADGSGVSGVFPPLAKSDYLTKSSENAIKAIKYGLQGAIVVNEVEYDNMMPAPGLEDSEVADVMNYISNTWGNTSGGKMITTEMVAKVKEDE